MKITKKKLLVSVMAMTVAAISLVGCGKSDKKKTIELNKYVSIKTEGYDGDGTAEYVFDEKSFMNDWEGKLSYTSKGKKEAKDTAAIFGESDEAEMLMALYIKGDIDKSEELSIGDKVKYEWDVNEEYKEYFKCDLVYSDIEFEVKDLQERPKFNPFDHMEIEYSGAAPKGTAEIKDDGSEEFNYIKFELDKKKELKNGDTITVKASLQKYILLEPEFVLEKDQETFTVEGLPEYISKAEDISKDMYDKMDKELRDYLKSEYAEWDGDATLHSMELLGCYVLSLKEGDSWGDNNKVDFVYKVVGSNQDTNGKLTYYWYGQYCDVQNLSDGTTSVDLSTAHCPMGVWDGDDLEGFSGYKEISSVFNNAVTKELKNYTYTATAPVK